MPYRIVLIKSKKHPEESGYYVETTTTGKLHSKYPMTYERAYRQMRALWASAGAEARAGDFIPFIKSIPGRVSALLGFNTKRFDYRPQDRNILRQYGNQTINGIYVIREPINNLLDKVMNLISLGTFNRMKAENNYSDYYHLYIIVSLYGGKLIRIEKNQTIELRIVNSVPSVEQLEITPSKNITLNQFLDNARKQMGDERYFVYDPKYYNCQVYIANLLSANGDLTPTINSFIMQNVDSLPSFTHAIARATTDLAHRADVVINGKGFRNKNIII